YQALLNEGFVTQTQYDQMVTNMKVLESTLEAERSNLENARLQLSYCYIYAPISGKIGSLTFDKGNLIKVSDDKAMAVINQISPIYIRFSVPEQYLKDLRQGGKMEVFAYITDPKENMKGILTFIDNTVDKATGTINLRADFENKDDKLWPGQFVNVYINLSTIKSAVVVPTEAIQSGQKGEYVYKLNDDMTVDVVNIVSGNSKDGWTVIKSGDLKIDNKVVTEGHLRIRPGIKVQEAVKDPQDKGKSN
ncbi:MAG: efflux RND transporter periplasmic adaptor subunit, partial [Thermodesulfovibrionales bacterium]|nr:efflux RND transporter periplasmic adaptor subunit [Thermodesulfovibrionales bacterium]